MPKFEFFYNVSVYFTETREEKRFEGSDTLEAGDIRQAEIRALLCINGWNRLGLLGDREIIYTYVFRHVREIVP